jgi:Eco57I restriction-modification methylase
MIAGLTGSLLSHDALERAVRPALAGAGGERQAESARRRLKQVVTAACHVLGPASSSRAVFDRVAVPFADVFGYQLSVIAGGDSLCAAMHCGGVRAAVLVATHWGVDPGAAWREAVRQGIGSGLRWCFCINGRRLRMVDAERTYSRRFADFDLELVVNDPASFALMWALLRPEALVPHGANRASALDEAVAACERHRAEVRMSLQSGVQQALVHLVGAFVAARRRRPRHAASRVPDGLFDESLIVIYRILFLLFAEARNLVPCWHPTYRDGYTIESLRAPAEMERRPRGLWESLQAIARLAHRGCRAGALRVPPFNGRLFSPTHAPFADSLPLDDGAVREALVALTTRPSDRGMERISYADLGVEQLGGVYERILDFEPALSPGARPVVSLVRANTRKTTGSFYTPRSLTEYVVRRTLAPLVAAASPERILELRVLDPAMGSGAFLVAACRYLAVAYEDALVREGGVMRGDITDDERAGFRRTIAQRCLYGVDLNPMAVQLARLSLWLATLASDRPLTFLDHHLRTGDSLLGASLADIARRPFARARHKPVPLPLFDDDALDAAIRNTVEPRRSLAVDPGDTLEQVRQKERTLALLDRDGPLGRWKAVADLWCARWFPPPEDPAAVERLRAAQKPGVFAAATDELVGRRSSLPEHLSHPLLKDAAAAAGRERFFHWALEFPEVFHDGPAGFDAVLGNPPWEMLRADPRSTDAGGGRGTMVTAFARGSGVYALQGDGHANLYQLFLERALTLTRRGGRIGLVLPSGFATDHGCAALRRRMLDAARIDSFVSIENRDGVFPIHRGVKFLLLTASIGGRTPALPMRTGVRSPSVLDELPDSGADPAAVDVRRDLIELVSGGQLAIPEFRSHEDVAIVSQIVLGVPALGSASGWGVRFGRELNATDDRRHFTKGHGMPVVEGKHVQPFAIDVAAAADRISRPAAGRLLPPDRTFDRNRLAYRDVAASTNRLTLIAAIVPAGVVTTHTLFCLKDGVEEDEQIFLCGIFNSYVANYLVRLRVTTHVTVAIVGRLPVPRPPRGAPAFAEVVSLARMLLRRPDDRTAGARLQARVAALYGLTRAQFAHVLDTFPLVDARDRAAALEVLTAP